jgi:hypothetical protein
MLKNKHGDIKMLNTTELEINLSYDDEPDEIRYLPLTCKSIKEHVSDGEFHFKKLLFCQQYDLAYTLFCDLLNNEEEAAFDILMSQNVKEMFLRIHDYNFSTKTISEEILHTFRDTIYDLFVYYSEQFQAKLNNQKDWN